MITSNAMFHGMSIYVCSDLLQFFVLHILPKITCLFVLVSGDSDLCVPRESLTQPETLTLVNNPKLLKWFAQNTRLQQHPKIIQLPIGLDYHTISTNPQHLWKKEGEGHLPLQQEEILVNLRKQMKPFYERNPMIYLHFSMNSDRFQQRKTSLHEIREDLIFRENGSLKRTDCWEQISQYAFVLSPFGVGMDCHRTWEALCLGAIPIVKAPDFTEMFEGLPVLIVKEWSDITRELLEKTMRDFKERNFQYEKLSLMHWVNRIRQPK